LFAQLSAVAGERSFTRAAQRLHVVQSAVLAAITALEKDLDVVLLERNARRVQLTEAGEALLPEAQAVLVAALAARDAVEGLSRGLRGTLRVGMLSDLGLMDLPGLARDFRDRHPGVELQLRDATAGSAGMLSALSGYDIDVAFAGSSGPLPREYAGRTLLRVPQLLAVPAGHALAGRRAVKVREHDFRWSLNAVVLRRRRLTAAAAALVQLAGAHLIEQPGVERPS